MYADVTGAASGLITSVMPPRGVLTTSVFFILRQRGRSCQVQVGCQFASCMQCVGPGVLHQQFKFKFVKFAALPIIDVC
jgi:hypothetical protein